MRGKLDQQGAETVAIQALVHLAQDHERLGQFLNETGIDPGDIRSAAADPGFLLAVLEHICADESYLLAYAANSNTNPGMIEAARLALAGHQDRHGSFEE